MLVRAEISAPACRVAQKLNRSRLKIALYLTTTSFKKKNRRRFLLTNYDSLFIIDPDHNSKLAHGFRI